MRTAPFEYHRAHDIDDALEWLTREEEREVKILAGGHSLLPLMKLKMATPGVLLDVQGLFALRGVSLEPGWVRIGALTRYVDLMRDRIVLESLPLLAQVAATVADLQVRNRGTIGGSLCHADPAADMPAAVLALEGRLVIVGPRGEHRVSLDEFVVAPFLTVLEPHEILAAIEFPLPQEPQQSVYLKRPHLASGYPVVGVAITGAATPRPAQATPKVAVTGMGSHAYRAHAAEEILNRHEPTPETLREAAAAASTEADYGDDKDLQYRSQLTRVYVERALFQFYGREP